MLGLASPKTAHNFKSYLRTRVQSLDLERMTTLTPWLQRRLGWGDARTTPELLEALQKVARWQRHCKWSSLLAVRREVAKAELRLRKPRVATNPGHPILATSMGELALLARKNMGDASLLNELQQASTSFPALPGPRHCWHWTTGHSRHHRSGARREGDVDGGVAPPRTSRPRATG